MNDTDRGTGLTTRQMQEAPQGGVFIWCNCQTSYAGALARMLKRSDLRILPASAFERGGSAVRGYERGMIVVDHAFADTATEDQRRGHRILREEGRI